MKLDNFLLRFLRRESSKDVAKKRLKFVLLQDRMNIEPETMETLKKDLLALLSRYFEIGQAGFEMDFHREEESMALVANVPIASMKVRSGAQAS